MFGNAEALAEIAELDGDQATSKLYAAKADTLKELIDANLV